MITGCGVSEVVMFLPEEPQQMSGELSREPLRSSAFHRHRKCEHYLANFTTESRVNSSTMS